MIQNEKTTNVGVPKLVNNTVTHQNIVFVKTVPPILKLPEKNVPEKKFPEKIFLKKIFPKKNFPKKICWKKFPWKKISQKIFLKKFFPKKNLNKNSRNVGPEGPHRLQPKAAALRRS